MGSVTEVLVAQRKDAIMVHSGHCHRYRQRHLIQRPQTTGAHSHCFRSRPSVHYEMTSWSGQQLGHLPFSAWISGSFSHELAVGPVLTIPRWRRARYCTVSLPPARTCLHTRTSEKQARAPLAIRRWSWPSESPWGSTQLPSSQPLPRIPKAAKGLLVHVASTCRMFTLHGVTPACLGLMWACSHSSGWCCHCGLYNPMWALKEDSLAL